MRVFLGFDGENIMLGSDRDSEGSFDGENIMLDSDRDSEGSFDGENIMLDSDRDSEGSFDGENIMLDSDRDSEGSFDGEEEFVLLPDQANLLLDSLLTLQHSDDYKRALAFFYRGQYQTAYDLFLKMSQDQTDPNYLNACLKLVWLYETREGFVASPDQVERCRQVVKQNFKWYEQQARPENLEARVNLGCLYWQRLSSDSGFAKGRPMLDKAAKQGHPEAQYFLSGGWSKKVESSRYASQRDSYKRIAEQGHAEAQYRLGAFADNDDEHKDQAKFWYEQAAKQGHVKAQYMLGVKYEKGRGVNQDYAEARAWYERAASNGCAEAETNLGWLYYEGLGVERDEEQTKVWWGQAASRPLNISWYGQEREPPLHWAVAQNRLDWVDFLTAQGADVNLPVGINKRKPLDLTNHQHPEMVKLLVERGADVNAVGEDGGRLQEYLSSFCSSGNACTPGDIANIIEFWIKQGANVNVCSADRVTLLHHAADSYLYEDAVGYSIAEVLLRHGANVNARDKDGVTPLRMAVGRWEDLKLIKLLLAHGADPNIRNSNSRSIAFQGANQVTPLCAVVRSAYVSGCLDDDYRKKLCELVRMLIEAGADIQARDRKGPMPLEDAIMAGAVDILEALLEGRSDLSVFLNSPIARHFAESPLGDAYFFEKPRSLLSIAAKAGHLNVIQWLLERGALINWRHEDGETALYHSKNAEVMQFLVESGADIHTPNLSGETVLHQLAKTKRSYDHQNNLEMLSVLMDAGADVDAQDRAGKIALTHAVVAERSLGTDDCVQAILKGHHQKFLFFAFGSHERVGVDSPVRMLSGDMRELIAQEYVASVKRHMLPK